MIKEFKLPTSKIDENSDIFSNDDFDLEKYKTEFVRNPNLKSYLIFFTPRSGSSWLTDIISKTGKMGTPGEWLNPNFIPDIAKSINANNPRRYFVRLRQLQSSNDFFGMELTLYHLSRSLDVTSRLFDYFPISSPVFYLIREDILAQAISLAKAVKTDVYHTSTSGTNDIADADLTFEYDAEEIEMWVSHIRRLERLTEQFFTASGIVPVRTTYENLIDGGEEKVLNAFAKALGITDFTAPEVESTHRKIGTALNDEYAARFRSENAEFMEEIETERVDIVQSARESGFLS